MAKKAKKTAVKKPLKKPENKHTKKPEKESEKPAIKTTAVEKVEKPELAAKKAKSNYEAKIFMF